MRPFRVVLLLALVAIWSASTTAQTKQLVGSWRPENLRWGGPKALKIEIDPKRTDGRALVTIDEDKPVTGFFYAPTVKDPIADKAVALTVTIPGYIFVVRPVDGSKLRCEVFGVFSDGSKRSNYLMATTFVRDKK